MFSVEREREILSEEKTICKENIQIRNYLSFGSKVRSVQIIGIPDTTLQEDQERSNHEWERLHSKQYTAPCCDDEAILDHQFVG